MNHNSNNTSPIAAIKTRVPPLPTKVSRPLITDSTQLDRQPTASNISIANQNTGGQATDKQEAERRRSFGLNMRGQTKLLDSSSYIPSQSNHLVQMSKHSYSETLLTNDLVKILKDENRNLKDQNNFLLTKLKQIAQSQKQLQDAIADYEIIIVQINKQNKYLWAENRQITEIAKKKVEIIGQKIADLISQKVEHELQTDARGPIDLIMQQFNTGSTHQYIHQLSNPLTENRRLSQGLPPAPSRNQYKIDNSTADSEMEELHNQFEALIYSCRTEKNLETRRNIRKKLVELTYRMKELKKKQ